MHHRNKARTKLCCAHHSCWPLVVHHLRIDVRTATRPIVRAPLWTRLVHAAAVTGPFRTQQHDEDVLVGVSVLDTSLPRQLLPYSNEQQVSEPTNESQTRERELPWHFVISARSLRSPRKLRLDASARRQASRRLYQVYAIACDAASTLLELRSSVGRQVRLICSD